MYEDEEEILYEVEDILDHRVNGGRTEYLIKWKNFSDKCDNTWEPESNLSCPAILQRYLARVQARKSASPETSQLKIGQKRPPPQDAPRARTPSASQQPSQGLRVGTIKRQTTSAPSAAPNTLIDQLLGQITNTSTLDPVAKATASQPALPNRYTTAATTSANKVHPEPSRSSQTSRRGGSHSSHTSRPKQSYPNPPTAVNPRPPASSDARQPSSRDPRLDPAARNAVLPGAHVHTSSPNPAPVTQNTQNTAVVTHIPRTGDPFAWEGTLYRRDKRLGDITIASISGKCPMIAETKAMLASSEAHYKDKRCTFVTYLNVRHLDSYMSQATSSLFDILPRDASTVNYGKLRNFLHVNHSAALVLLDKHPWEVLAIVPFSEALAKRFALSQRSRPNLFMVYLNGIPPRRDDVSESLSLYKPSDFYYSKELDTNPAEYFNWQLMAVLLGFPKKLCEQAGPDSFIRVFGTSKLAMMLEKASSQLVSSDSRNTQRIFMFDRHGDQLLKSSLRKHKQDLSHTTIWVFGIPGFGRGTILPTVEAYPKYSGGFITTDVANLMRDPNIINHMVAAAEKLGFSPAFEKWQVIFKNDIFDRLQDAARDVESAKRVQEIVALLTVCLNRNQCKVMHDWGVYEESVKDDTEDTLRWLTRIVRAFYEKKEYFIMVDDAHSTDHLSKNYLAIDFLHAKEIVETCSKRSG